MIPRLDLLRRSAWALAALALGLLSGWGCSNESSTPEGVTHPTMIEVAPEEFLGSLGCSSESSSVQRYVATLFDVTDEGAGGAAADDPPRVDDQGVPLPCGGFQLPSSEPTACLASVGFGYVVHGRRYCVEVDAYDTDQIEPRGTGTRKMVAGDPTDGELSQQAPLVQPRWSTSCDGATAFASTVVRARGCVPLFPQPVVTDPATVRVETANLLGDFTCGTELGQVDYINVSLTYEGLADGIHRTPSCGSFALFEDLPGEMPISLYVRAYSGGEGGDQIAGATCYARTVPGGTALADCAALSEQGTLRVDLASALFDAGFGCDESVTDVRVSQSGQLLGSFPPPDCLEPFDYAVTPGPDEERVIVTFQHMGSEVTLTCHGNVEPGRVVVAQCDVSEDTEP